jgi:ribonuclease HI
VITTGTVAGNKQSQQFKKLITYSDGGARGNPGPAGVGGQIQAGDGEILAEISEYIGETTNNIAEYTALILTLERAREFAARELEIRADSELMVKQLKGQYKVKNEGLKPLHSRAKELISAYGKVNICHVYREQNKRADELANEALDRQADIAAGRVVVERDSSAALEDSIEHEQGKLF